MQEGPDRATGTGTGGLALLKGLVIVLTGTMIVGFVVLIVLLVIRFPVAAPQAGPTAPDLPDEITMPEGERAVAVTFGSGWYAVVTESDAILIFDRATGVLRQRVEVQGPAAD